MKKTLNLQVCFALLLAAAPLAATAQTTFFSDNFNTGSTLNQPVATPTGTSTSYQTYIGLAGGNTTSSIAPHDLSITFPNTTSVLGEFVGLFTNTAVPLTAPGDYIAINVVFINSSNILINTSGNSTLDIGLFDSGGVPPNQGNITLNAATNNVMAGGTQTWLGYIGRIFQSGSPSFLTRPRQTPNGTTAQNQDLLFSNASSSQAFNQPNGTAVGSANGSTNITLVNGSTYTMQFVIYYNSATSLAITNAIYAGSGTGGTQLFSMGRVATNATFLTGGFDGLAVGWRNSTAASQASTMDVSSIQVYGHSTPVTTPPNIISQPVSVTVPTGASCAFSVSAIGFGMGYQWHRNGTNLLDGGNISGSTKNLLVISPAGAADVAPSNNVNGYYVTISGTGGYSTNSVTNALALTTATNLIWTDNASTTWDVNNSVNWVDTNGNATVFNFGDPVIFNDVGFGGPVTLTGSYLSAASVTVSNSSSYSYNFSSASSGSFAGPGNLIYIGAGGLTVGNANTYTGGTIISNAIGVLLLQNLGGFGTGPVTLAGGKMEVVPAGGASSSIPNDFVVANDFTIQFDGTGSYAGDFNGNFSGTVGKTLTFVVPAANTSTNERVRIYGENTTYNANLALNSSVITLAPYNGSSNQTYNGIISGVGGLIQRANGTTILNNTNTYSGGTTPSTGAIGFGTNTIGTVTSGPIGTGPLYLAPEVPNLSGSGTVFASGGARTIANPIQYPSATNNLTLIIGGANNLTFSGPFTLNGNDGLGTNNIRNLQVTNTALTTFSGVISDVTNSVSAGFGLTITGTGTNATGPVILNNTETYTGPTTVTNSTLQVNGSLNAASVVTVSSNATLAGTGTINGPVTVSVGGKLAPSTPAAIGTLHINNSLALNGNLLFKVQKLVSQSNDIALVSGTLANGGTGTLTVTNIGPAFVVGDKFYLFNKLMTGGGALTVTGGGVTWNNSLGTDGSISVASLTVAKPVITNIVINSSSTSLVFSGTNATLGANYYVLYQTNLTKPLTSWIPVSTNAFLTGGTFSVSVTNSVLLRDTNQFFIFKMF